MTTDLSQLARSRAESPIRVVTGGQSLLDLARSLPARRHPALGALAVVCGLGLVWLAIASAGNDGAMADLMYLPILAAGWFFGVPGGIVAALAAVALLGPLGTSHVELDDLVQGGGIYVFIGALAGAASSVLIRRLNRLTEMALRLGTTYANTLSVIATSLELRDRDTGGHSARVASNAKVLGERVGLSPDDLIRLYWAGILHDIGKIAVPEAILHKPGPLTSEEWGIMQTHVEIGVRLLEESSPDFDPVAHLVACHHERWDGLGYPAGLKGEQIPLSGRMLTVVDVFDALTSARPYRDPFSATQALAYLREHSGSQFDPNVVGVFDAALASGDISIGAEVAPLPQRTPTRRSVLSADRRTPVQQSAQVNAESGSDQVTLPVTEAPLAAVLQQRSQPTGDMTL